MILNVDFEAAEIETQFQAFVRKGLFLRCHNILDSFLRANFQKQPDTRDFHEIEGYLNSCRSFIEGELTEKAQYFSPATWTWYIRRLPALNRQLKTSDPYDKGLLHGIACMSEIEESTAAARFLDNRLVFPLNKHSLEELFKLYAGAVFLSEIHTCLRFVGKRIAMQFTDHSLPIEHATSEEREAIRLYDKRVERGSVSPFHRTGTILTNTEVSGSQVLESEDRILLAHHTKRKVIRTRCLQTPIKTVANFNIELFDLSELSDFAESFNENLWWNSEVGDLILLLRCAALAITMESPRLIPLAFAGYFLIPSVDLLRVVSPTFDRTKAFVERIIPGYKGPQDFEGLFQLMSNWKPKLWPVIAPKPVHQVQNCFMIDIDAACRRLNTALEFPRTLSGEAGTIRGLHFEQPTQTMIDESPWAPGNALAAIRGRQLRLDGADITDLDAIGSKDGILLCVSCKSLVYSGEYDNGDNRVVMNAAQAVEEKLLAWESKAAKLRSNPRGDNYDFSSFREMIFVVCIPSPVYVPIGPCTNFIAKDLRAVVSFSELAKWVLNN